MSTADVRNRAEASDDAIPTPAPEVTAMTDAQVREAMFRDGFRFLRPGELCTPQRAYKPKTGWWARRRAHRRAQLVMLEIIGSLFEAVPHD